MHRVTEVFHHREQHSIGFDNCVATQLARAEPAVFAAAGHVHGWKSAADSGSAAGDHCSCASGAAAAIVDGRQSAASADERAGHHHHAARDDNSAGCDHADAAPGNHGSEADDVSDDDVAGGSQREPVYSRHDRGAAGSECRRHVRHEEHQESAGNAEKVSYTTTQ